MEGLQLVEEQAEQGIPEDTQEEELRAGRMWVVAAGRSCTVVEVAAEVAGGPTCSASCVKRARHRSEGPGCRSHQI